MKPLYTFFSKVSYLGFCAIGLVLFAFAAGLAYQIDVAANIMLGWGYLGYAAVLIGIQIVLIRQQVVKHQSVELLLAPNSVLLLMMGMRVLTMTKQPFFELQARDQYHFVNALMEWAGPIVSQPYAVLFPLVLGISIIFGLLGWLLRSINSGDLSLPFGKPAWQNVNQERALKAVAKVTDQAKLKEIAELAQGAARHAAINRITDQEYLLNLARNEKEKPVRKLAVARISNQATLGDIAKTDKDVDVCMAAVSKLEDEALLAEIAKLKFDRRMYESDLERLCQAALHKLTDPPTHCRCGHERALFHNPKGFHRHTPGPHFSG